MRVCGAKQTLSVHLFVIIIVNAIKNNMLILVTVSYLIQNTLIYVFHVFPCYYFA